MIRRDPFKREHSHLHDVLSYFTDREKAISYAERYMDLSTDEPLKVLMFYGVGGIGKTALQLKLIDNLRKNNKILPFARLNIEEVRVKTGDPSEALLRLRTSFEGDFGVKFPRFDLCLAVITAHQGGDPEPFVRINPALQDMFSFANNFLSLPVDGLSGLVDGLIGIFPDVEKKVRHIFKTEDVIRLRHLESQDLMNELIRSFMQDLAENLPNREGKFCRGVMFLDTYESFWKGHEGGISAQARLLDEWVRELANYCLNPKVGVLLIISGRERLRWAEDDPEWKDVLDQQLLGGLSVRDAQLVMSKLNVGPSPKKDEPTLLQRAIINLCREGSDAKDIACHPFYLSLCAEIVLIIREGQGNDPSPDIFSNIPNDKVANDLATLFLKSLDSRALELWVTELSLTLRFNEETALSLDDERNHHNGRAGWERIVGFSFMQVQPDGFYRLHKIMRDVLRTRMEITSSKDVHRWFYNHWKDEHENFIEASYHLIKSSKIINDNDIEYFLSLPDNAYVYFIINEILKNNKIGNTDKIFKLVDKYINSNDIIISFLLSYGYYFEDLYVIDKKKSVEVYNKIIDSNTDIKVFEAISNSVSVIANLHPSVSLEIWKKLVHINEDIIEAVVFYISSSDLKSDECMDFLSEILSQNTNLSINTKQRINNIFLKSEIIKEEYDTLSIKYHLNEIRRLSRLSTDYSINYIENNYTIINPSFTLEVLSKFVRYDKVRIYELIKNVVEYHAQTCRIMIFQASEILCESLKQEDLSYINLFLKRENDNYTLLVGIHTLDLLSNKFESDESELLSKYLKPIFEHEDITIKKIAMITKNIIRKKKICRLKPTKKSIYFKILKTCMNPKNFIPMLRTELFNTTPFVMIVWMWATKKANENYNIYEIYDVCQSTLKSPNPVILDASLCLIYKLQTDPKKYINLVHKYAYKSKEKQVRFGSICQFIFMGNREPEIIDGYLKDMKMDKDDDLVFFLLENLRLYKNQDCSNKEEMLNYLINHKNPDISGFSDLLLNGI